MVFFLNGTWQKRRREQDNGLSFEIGEMTPQMQKAAWGGFG